MKNRSELTHTILVITASMMWGFGFSIQSIGAKFVDAFTFMTVRNWVSFLAMLPVILIADRLAARRGTLPQDAGGSGRAYSRRLFPMRGGCRKDLWLGSCLTGLFTFGCMTAQQIGVAHTTSAKVGFISAMYVVIVPLLLLFMGKRPAPKIWACVALSVAGLFLLCMKGSFSLQFGDAVVLVAALMNSFQVLSISHYVQKTELLRFTTLQFFFGAVFSTVFMLILEHPSASGILKAAPSILYAGIVANCIAFSFQVIGQKGLSPTLTGLAMSLESVFSALAGIVILHQFLSGREILGCILMFAAILFSQISLPAKKKDTSLP